MIQVTQRDRGGGEQAALKKNRVSLRGVCVGGVNSTVTRHSDYIVCKDTPESKSERVARHFDDTSWREASEFLCITTHLFLREFSNKKTAKTPRKRSVWRDANATFLKFHKKPRGFS